MLGRNLFGNFLRIANFISLPKPIERMQADQDKIDIMTKNLSLYNFANCPFCIKVRRFMHESNINIDILMQHSSNRVQTRSAWQRQGSHCYEQAEQD